MTSVHGTGGFAADQFPHASALLNAVCAPLPNLLRTVFHPACPILNELLAELCWGRGVIWLDVVVASLGDEVSERNGLVEDSLHMDRQVVMQAVCAPHCVVDFDADGKVVVQYDGTTDMR